MLVYQMVDLPKKNTTGTEAPTQISDQCSFSVVASSSWSAWIFFESGDCGGKLSVLCKSQRIAVENMGKLWENYGKTMLIYICWSRKAQDWGWLRQFWTSLRLWWNGKDDSYQHLVIPTINVPNRCLGNSIRRPTSISDMVGSQVLL